MQGDIAVRVVGSRGPLVARWHPCPSGRAALANRRRERRYLLAYFVRSEEHTSELQSHSDLVCRLLLGNRSRRVRTVVRTSTRMSRYACQEKLYEPRNCLPLRLYCLLILVDPRCCMFVVSLWTISSVQL